MKNKVFFLMLGLGFVSLSLNAKLTKREASTQSIRGTAAKVSRNKQVAFVMGKNGSYRAVRKQLKQQQRGQSR